MQVVGSEVSRGGNPGRRHTQRPPEQRHTHIFCLHKLPEQKSPGFYRLFENGGGCLCATVKLSITPPISFWRSAPHQPPSLPRPVLLAGLSGRRTAWLPPPSVLAHSCAEKMLEPQDGDAGRGHSRLKVSAAPIWPSSAVKHWRHLQLNRNT